MTSTTISTARSAVKQYASILLTLDGAKSALFYYVLLTHAVRVKRHLRARGITASAKELYTWISQQIVHLILRIPSTRKKVAAQMDAAILGMENRLVPKGANVTRHLSLPSEGKSLEWILSEMDKMDTETGNAADSWKQGKISGAVYHGGDDISNIIIAAYSRYCVSNPLHPDVFPGVRKMEAEIVAMCLKMYRAPEGAAGAMTSGGTESIIMAVKTYRDWARSVKGIKHPEMIVSTTAHAAFDKGAAYLGIKVHTIPINKITRQIDIAHVKRAINPNTILLVGSCINFPDGNQDDIEALSVLAKKYKLGLHVDCCLGSFIVPFLESAGLSKGDAKGRYRLSPFDFSVDGVTSISCDTHKYGFAPKGTSVIMYRSMELRRFQYYINAIWPGGVYASPSISGSRPGALIAGTWAVMQHIGSEGYRSSCREIVLAARTIADAITDDIPELYILGNPPASCIAFGSRHPGVDPLEVGDAMRRRGWHLNALREPKSVHIACTRLTVPVVETFIADLKDAVRESKGAPAGKGTMVSLYGTSRFSLFTLSLSFLAIFVRLVAGRKMRLIRARGGFLPRVWHVYLLSDTLALLLQATYYIPPISLVLYSVHSSLRTSHPGASVIPDYFCLPGGHAQSLCGFGTLTADLNTCIGLYLSSAPLRDLLSYT
ncbi:pyridoxal phosphate-dependent transferase [Crassisporium funariophilum]|nr:pyridoxal phosphate-dependent transferase [Crassisporium funariophilum]